MQKESYKSHVCSDRDTEIEQRAEDRCEDGIDNIDHKGEEVETAQFVDPHQIVDGVGLGALDILLVDGDEP